MRGLLTKDICLILRQKNMLLMMALILLLLSRHGLEFTLGCFVFICFLLGDTTVGYDSADRGLSYLMTFPISRNTYVFEKYVLTLCPGMMATVAAVAIRFMAAKVQGQTADAMEIALSCIGIFFLCSLMIAVFLPMELLGMEKARIVMNIASAAVGVGLVVLMKNEAALERIRAYAMRVTESIHGKSLGFGVLGIWLVVMTSSIVCSMLIMKKKQF